MEWWLLLRDISIHSLWVISLVGVGPEETKKLEGKEHKAPTFHICVWQSQASDNVSLPKESILHHNQLEMHSWTKLKIKCELSFISLYESQVPSPQDFVVWLGV